MSRHFDPRFGETVYRLVNVVRCDPPGDLFMVPDDYALQDALEERARFLRQALPESISGFPISPELQ